MSIEWGGIVSKFEKLLQRIKQLDKGLRFDEVKKMVPLNIMIVSVNRYQRIGRIGTTVAEQSVPS